MAVGHLLWDYVDHNTCREKYYVTSFPTKVVSDLTSTIVAIANIKKTHFLNNNNK